MSGFLSGFAATGSRRSSAVRIALLVAISSALQSGCREGGEGFVATPVAETEPIESQRFEAAGERFERCFFNQLSANVVDEAFAFSVFARSAPREEVARLVAFVRSRLADFPPVAHPKILGEAAWALAEVGARDEARQAALAGAALPKDGLGGRLTALAVLGRLGALADAERLAERDWQALSAIAFGAAVGTEREAASRLRAEIEASPGGSLLARSAVHLKLVAALGDRGAIEAALADRASPTLLIDALAVVEGAARTGNTEVMLVGVRALSEANTSPGRQRAEALIGAARAAGVAGARSVVDLAVGEFDEIPISERTGMELVPAAVYGNVGDVSEARRRFDAMAPSTNPVDRVMVEAGLAAAAGAWDRFPSLIPGASAVLTADVWRHALASKIDDTTRARVLDALCGGR